MTIQPTGFEEAEEAGATFDFDVAFQDKVAGLFARDTTFAKRTADLIEPEYFTEAGTVEFVRIIKNHLRQFGHVPDPVVFVNVLRSIKANKSVREDLIEPIKQAYIKSRSADLTNQEFVAQKVQSFAQHQAIQNAMMEAIPLLEKGGFDKIREIMQKATSITLGGDFETYNYFERIGDRTAKRDQLASGAVVTMGITTGYDKLNQYLYHKGWGRKELSCIMGPAKSGKSLSLGDFAKNASLAGFNVIYVSLEVAKEIISERIDAAMSDTLMSDLVLDRAKVESEIRRMQINAGVFEVIDFPSGTLKVSALDRVLEQYRDRGTVFDMVVVDYADIMCPEVRTDKLTDALREVYIDLRALSHKWNAAFLTATQTNRDGAKAVTAKATDVGDDWNKVRTVDILIGLNATDAEKAAGEMRLYWAVSRNTADGFSIRIQQDRSKMQFLVDVLGVEH